MKTNIFYKIGITSLCITFMSLSGFAQSKREKNHTFPFYYSNAGLYEKMPSQVVSKLDESGKFLQPYCKYDFTYDDQKRVIRKEAFQWNENHEKWSPNYVLTFIYHSDRIETEYAVWNQQKKSYAAPHEKVVYIKSNQGITAYSGYKKNALSHEWELVTDLPNLQPNRLGLENDIMLARTIIK